MIAYGVPALVLTLGGVLLLLATPLPNGFIPLFVATSVHCFFYFCVLLAFALATDSQTWTSTVMIFGNVSVSFVIPGQLLVYFVWVAVSAGLLAAIVPARRASRLKVLESLQYE